MHTVKGRHDDRRARHAGKAGGELTCVRTSGPLEARAISSGANTSWRCS